MWFGVWFPGGSILGLLLLCHLVVGEVCGPATPTSSAEFLIQLAFAWLSLTVLGLISGPASIFSIFCGFYEIMWKNIVEPGREATGDNMVKPHFTLDS